MARVGLGALGILTTITFRVEPLFVLEAREQPMSWDEALDGFDEMTAARRPRRHVLVPAHRPDADQAQHPPRAPTCRPARPLSRRRAWLDDEFLQNTAFGVLTAGANRVPGVIPRMNRMSAPLLSARTYSDVPHRVFTASRRVVFREMEYAVPREAGLDALREAAARSTPPTCGSASRSRSGWRPPTTSRCPRPSGRDSFYLAFHTHRDADHRDYFALMEPILRAHDGRPHWGKVHTRTAADLRAGLPAVRTTSSRCATGSTRTGCSPTTTCGGCWATDLRRRSRRSPAWRTARGPAQTRLR